MFFFIFYTLTGFIKMQNNTNGSAKPAFVKKNRKSKETKITESDAADIPKRALRARQPQSYTES